MAAKQYNVMLAEAERDTLSRLISTGKAAARKFTHAHLLLQADESQGQPAWTDQQISQALHVSPRTIERVRETFVTDGMEAALTRKTHARTRPLKLDGKQEAYLIALACSTPPAGRERWTMQLLTDKLVELNIVESVSDETIRLRLQKTTSSPG